ncbi:MAG: P1 family peptidase [Rhodovibrionaceae bacterium]
MDPLRETPSGLPRARAYDLPFEGTPGANNTITDVAELQVGYTTLIEGAAVRTGVTAILPRGRSGIATPCWSGFFSLNGNGEMTGSHWIEETGACELAVTITNTHSLGVARDATIKWATRNPVSGDGMAWGLPAAAETYDGYLNDINGFHVTEAHVFAAIEAAASGPVEEGSVGGGTGMICYGFKGGSGTASRATGGYTLGAFVQANFGRPHELTVAGVPVGRELEGGFDYGTDYDAGSGSIIVVLATDAPLLPHQLKRLARRAALGIGRSGAIGHHASGDIFLALSTANAEALAASSGPATADFLPDESLNFLFAAAIQAVDEAVLNALFANADMTGRAGRLIRALPRERVRDLLAAAGRLAG